MSAAPDLLLLAELRAAGFEVRRRDDSRDRLTVAPIGRLTEEQKARIASGKPALLAALDAECILWRDLERRIRRMGARWWVRSPDLSKVTSGRKVKLLPKQRAARRLRQSRGKPKTKPRSWTNREVMRELPVKSS